MSGNRSDENRSELSVEQRFAIEDLLTEFGQRVDHGRAASVAELFVEDGRLVTPMFTLQGREQIAAHFSRRDLGGTVQSRHQWSNLKLGSMGEGRMRAETIVQTHLGTRRDGGPTQPDHVMVGDSIDVLARQADGSWCFVERRLHIAFRTEFAPPAAPDSQSAHG